MFVKAKVLSLKNITKKNNNKQKKNNETLPVFESAIRCTVVNFLNHLSGKPREEESYAVKRKVVLRALCICR